MDREREERARRRNETLVVRKFRLGEEPADDWSHLTAVERIELALMLSDRTWALTGLPWPAYDRSATPGRVIRSRS